MKCLSEANINAHSNRPLTPEGQFITLWQPSSSFIHCCIESCGCRYSREAGACIMCDYGAGRNITPVELRSALYSELYPYIGKIDRLLFGSYGSVLDESEVSAECFQVLLRFLCDNPVPNIIFETHCETVTRDKLKRIQEEISADIQITIEMGYESSDPFILQTCLNKIINLDVLEKTIALIHEERMRVCLNVFLGAPFLCAADQLASAKDSVLWAMERGVDSIVLFPANIKPFTLVYKLYEQGIYVPLSHWMIPALFRILPNEALERITLSWYGNRKNFYKDDAFPLIPPQDCDECHDVLFSFYHEFMKEPDGHKRAEMTRALWDRNLSCNCKEDLNAALQIYTPRKTAKQINQIVSSL